MKVKQTPADFRVEELTDAVPGSVGDFAFYRLDKRGWTTPDALAVIRKRWKVALRRVAIGGLKDRHADTTQYLTIHHGPSRKLNQQQIQVTYLGQLLEPYSSERVKGNRFSIVLRQLSSNTAQTSTNLVERVGRIGLPNYFDDQRFGSVTRGHTFIGKEMVLGHFETALKLALLEPTEHDRTAETNAKAILRRHWGDWATGQTGLRPGPVRDVVRFLQNHPTDFRGAVTHLRPDLQGLYLAAYQSHLWNRTLDRWLRATFPASNLGRISLRVGTLAVPLEVPESLCERWERLTIPLPSARLQPDETSEWLPHLEAVLEEEGLSLDKLKVPGLRKPFFSKGIRSARLVPAQLRVEAGADELNPGWRKLLLQFELPRGSYATLLVKCITATPTGLTSSSPVP